MKANRLFNETPQILIKTNGVTGTEVFVDGKKIEGVSGLRFIHSYRENGGIPILQIDLKATNVTLDAKMLPTLPEPYRGKYISICSLLNSGVVSKDTVTEICRDQGIDLEIS